MLRLLALTLLAFTVVAAPAHAASQNVSIGDFFYSSDRVRVDPGESVTWTNRGDVLHTVTSRRGVPQGFNSGNVDSSQTFTRAFTRAGTYSYVCTLHPGLMSGVVQVGPDRVKPEVSRVKATAGKRVRVAFRLSETSKVVARITLRGRVVRTISKRKVAAGSKSLTSSKRLAQGSYRVTVRATDVEGNKAKPATAKLVAR